MSEFTNPAYGVRATSEAYVKALLALLADRDPIDVLRDTPVTLRRRIENLSPEELQRPERPGKWSAAEVVQHLADSDLVWAYRLRMVLAQERPELSGYDQDRWARRFRYGDRPVTQAIDQFVFLRTMNLGLIEDLQPDDLVRVAVHRERGEESVALMLRLYAGHDLVHLNQLDRILAG